MDINNRKLNLKINFSKNRPLLGNNKTSTGKIDLSKNNSITIGNPNLTLTETTYTLNQLKNNYKFTDNVIHKYFKAAPLQGFTKPTLNNRTVTYIVNTATGCKTINDVVNIVYQDYQKDLILDNFLNNANRKSDKAEDLSKTKNGTKLSKDNYKQYIDEISLATGEEAKELRRAAVNKMIQDFTQGNLSVLLLAELFKAIGITDISGSTKNNLLTYNFVFENKKYSMTCNAKEAASGTDTKTVTTYTQEDLLANKGATEELINKYFEPVSQEAGKSTNYKLRDGKTYAAFLEALKPKTEEKNGTFESKNEAGHLVETTYKDGKVTKIVEYDSSSKSKRRTETEYNKDGSQTITKYDYSGDVKSAIEYDKNGKITQETQYTYSGKEVTKYNTDGSKIKYVYDKEGNITLEIHTSKDGKERYFKTTVNNDGSKTRLEYDKEYWGDVIGKTEYDAQGRLTYSATYNGIYVTDKKITYNADGSRTEIQYKEHSESSKDPYKAAEKTYDKNGNLISDIVYKNDEKQSETKYTYDSKGLVSKTVIQYQNELKDKETVTDKNGKKLSETVYKGSWTDPDSGTEYKSGTYGAIIQTTYDGAKTTETIKVNDGKTLLRETITDTDENTKTVNNYSNGKMNTQIVTDLNGNKLSEIGYDQNGKMLYTTKWDYKNNTEATTFADGSTSSKKIGNTTAELKSVSGTKLGVTIKGKYQVSFGTILTKSDHSNYFANTTYNCFVLKNNNDEITQRVVYNPGGSIKTIQTFTYDYTDKKNYKVKQCNMRCSGNRNRYADICRNT